MTHEEAKKLKSDIDLLGLKISRLVEEKQAKQDLLQAKCPHKYKTEWDDWSDNIWSQCSLCFGDGKIIGKVSTHEDRIYNNGNDH